MHERVTIFLLTYMVAAAIPLALTFNVDIKNPDVHRGNPNDFYGYKVLQFSSGKDKGIIVTAPLRLNGSGGICNPNVSNECFSPPEIVLNNKTIPVKHLGLSIAEDKTHSQFTACSPSVAHECHQNSYLNSMCYTISNQLKEISSFKSAFQECKKKIVNLVFLFDGSGSMTTDEFNKNKIFIMDIMKNLKNTTITFAAVQFSTDYRKVFDFNDYQKGIASKSLDKESHMKSLTNTHKALKFVLEEILDNPTAGASPDATKVLVLITDGDPSDGDNDNIIAKYNDKKILRFVIGVKNVALDKFTKIASVPTNKYAFKIENYGGLTGLLERFQQNIFKVEGTKVAQADDLKDELAQSGFSAVFHKDTLILGSVGTKNWRGSLRARHGKDEIQIEVPDMKIDSYLGYSVSTGKKNEASLYFAGAPRFNHMGQVVVFRHNGRRWTAAQTINGDLIGSYFGAELCSVDINSDNDTDFLLVGAPLFYQPQEKREGQIYVYRLTEEMTLESKLNVSVASMGRFGSTISSLADLNGDGLRDVAVGAPLDDDNRGAVYIYLGDRHRGIHSTFSQRIMGETINSQLRFFGQAIDGDIDLGEDGLPDIVIGSQGMAVVLRSRPVFNVFAHLSFHPGEISTDHIDCVSKTEETIPMVTLTACFEMVEITKSKSGAASSGLNISSMVTVDPQRKSYRGFFSKTDKKAQNLTTTYKLRDKNTCFNYSIYMPKCVKDTLLPVRVKLNFSLADSESASAVLNLDMKQYAVVQVPFEKQCRQNDTCIAELEVDFNFTTSTLFVAEDNYFNMSIKLSNHGDDSYNTSLTMHYPQGLSFSRMTLKKASRPTLHNCLDLDEVYDKTICGVSLPVYRSRSHATFETSFHILNEQEWNDTVTITVTGNSDNANSSWTSSLTKSINIQYEVKMALTVNEDTVTYINFTTEKSAPEKMVIMYKINNPGWKTFPINVSLVFPTFPKDFNFEMKNPHVLFMQNETKCGGITDKATEYCSTQTNCKIMVCEPFNLKKESTTEFKLVADVHFKDLTQQAEDMPFLEKYTGRNKAVKFKTFIHVNYDKNRYVLDSSKHESEIHEVEIEFIIPPDKEKIILTGVGVGILFLIIITIIMFKLGCFKRKTAGYYHDQEAKEQEAQELEAKELEAKELETCPPAAVNKPETDQVCEEKPLLDQSNHDSGSANESSKQSNAELDV